MFFKWFREQDINLDLNFELLFCLAVTAALYGSVGHGGASGYLAVLSLSSYATQDAIWLKTHALCLNLVVASLGLYHFSRKGFLNIKFIIPFIITSIPFAYLGAYIPIIDWLFEVLLSVTLLWAAVRLLINVNKVKSNSNYLPKYGVCACYGAGLGFLSGLVAVSYTHLTLPTICSL